MKNKRIHNCGWEAEASGTTTAVWQWWVLPLGVQSARRCGEFVCACGGGNLTLRLLYTAVGVYAFNQSPTPLSTTLPPRQSTSIHFAHPYSIPFHCFSIALLTCFYTHAHSLSLPIHSFLSFCLSLSNTHACVRDGVVKQTIGRHVIVVPFKTDTYIYIYI